MAKLMTKSEYVIMPLQNTHAKSTLDLFIKSFCDSEPTTKHLGITYKDYEPFAKEVIKKAIKDGMSVVAVNQNDRVVACAISEDITDQFEPHLTQYPKMKPIFGLLETLSKPFMQDRKFIRGKVNHIWIAIVDAEHRGQGLSTQIDSACADLAVRNGYDFVYAEFTNDVSAKITNHYPVHKAFNTINFEDFEIDHQKPFQGLKGSATAYLIGIRPGLELDAFQQCFKS